MIWIVEPHADDAFLSCHEHIVRWIREDRRVGIVTVYSNSKRDGEGAEYAAAVGAEYRSLAVRGGMNGLRGTTVPCPPVDSWGLEIGRGDRLVFPLGLQHPDHLAVRAAATAGCWFYIDTPYQAKLKLSDDLSAGACGKVVRSIIFPRRTKWKHVALFKSQALFFHYNPPESMYRLPEMILRDDH